MDIYDGTYPIWLKGEYIYKSEVVHQITFCTDSDWKCGLYAKSKQIGNVDCMPNVAKPTTYKYIRLVNESGYVPN